MSTEVVPVYHFGECVGWATIDADDLSLVSRYTWRLGTKGYIIASAGKGKTVRLHRLLMGLDVGDSRQVDHINRDTWNNTRDNLRVVTAQVNNENKGRYRNYAGHAIQQRNGRWQARVRHQGTLHHLGTYDTQDEATAVAERFREQVRGG